MEINYHTYAEASANQFTKVLSDQFATPLKFNGYARGPNIFIEAADVVTTRWAAIGNRVNQLARGYAPIRRSCWKDRGTVHVYFDVCNFVIPPITAYPDYPDFIKPADSWLKVNAKAVEQLTAEGQIWVGEGVWSLSAGASPKNVDEMKEYQRDYYWVECPSFPPELKPFVKNFG